MPSIPETFFSVLLVVKTELKFGDILRSRIIPSCFDVSGMGLRLNNTHANNTVKSRRY